MAIAAVLLFGFIGSVAGPGWNPQPLDYSLVPQTADTAIGGGQAAEPLGTYDTNTEVTSVELDGITIEAAVHQPLDAPGNRPGVLFMHGAGTASHNNFHDIAEALASSGVYALVPDKRMDTYTTRQRDYIAMAGDYNHSLQELAQWPGVDEEKVGLYAESEGAFIAPVSAVHNDLVSFVILVSAPVVSPRQQGAFATDAYLRQLGAPVQLLRAVPRLLGSEVPGGGFVYADFDPRPYQRRMEQPVLMAYGTADASMPTVQGPLIVIEDLAEASNSDYTLRYFDEANHGIRIAGELAPGFREAVSTWVQGLPTTAHAHPRIAGAQPEQKFRADAVDAPRWYASGDMIILTLVGGVGLILLGPLLWTVRRVVRRQSEPLPTGLARSTAALGLCVLAVWVCFVSYLLMVADLAVHYEQSPLVVQGGWLGIQLLGIAATGIGVWSAARWLTVRRKGRHTGTIATITLVGTHLGALVLLLAAGYWGIFPNLL